MSYVRVIPRDLFNEANLLKCYGRMALCLEKLNNKAVQFETDVLEDPFEIDQGEDGDLWIQNLPLVIHNHVHYLIRPLNSRDAYPVMLEHAFGIAFDERVFTEDGELSDAFLEYIRRPNEDLS